jgi:hypothetical protein
MGCIGGGSVDVGIEGIDEILSTVAKKLDEINKTFNNQELLDKKADILKERHQKLANADKNNEATLTTLIKELNKKDLEIDNELIMHQLNKMKKLYEIGLEYSKILQDLLIKQLEKKLQGNKAAALIQKQIDKIKKLSPAQFLDSEYAKPLKDLLTKKGLSESLLDSYIKELTEERSKRRKEERDEFGIKVNEYPNEELYDALQKNLFKEMLEETANQFLEKMK